MEAIDKLIEIGENGKALELVNNLIQMMKEGEFDEERYKLLLQKRLMLNLKLDKVDELVHDAVWRKKFPATVKYPLSNKTKLELINQSTYSKSSDAYVATIHRTKYFDYSQKGAADALLKRLGADKVYSQFDRNKPRLPGEFITLNHPELNAPLSYHILYYNDEKRLDLDVMENGIVNVLKDCEKRKLKEISCFALGFSYVSVGEAEGNLEIASQISDRVARTIVGYFLGKSNSSIEKLNFVFINQNTMTFYISAFNRWTLKSKAEFEYSLSIDSRLKEMIAQCKTQNKLYISELENLHRTMGNNSTIVILGEAGVGKSFLAKQIHESSQRASAPFKSENCSLIKGDRIYTTLFGAAKGSYTGAVKDYAGLIEEADGGTLFLDEIGEADWEIQKQLLTFLDDKKFRRLGENNLDRHSDIRLIFGTNRNLIEMVSIGIFAHDFYERINQIVITIPPLRERREDIPLYINSFLEELSRERGYQLNIEQEATQYLMERRWPGNVRQLRFLLENTFNYCQSQNSFTITKEILLHQKIDEYRLQKNSIFHLENLFKNFLGEWSQEKGKFLQDFIEPIIAKVYLDDLKLNKVDASEILGITGSKGSDSTLTKRYDIYKEAITKFNPK